MDKDLISREAAKDVIANMQAVAYSPYATIGRLDALLELNKLPCIEQRGQWIPVTERLPDINDHYTSDVCLVYCDNGAYAFAELEENIFGQVGWDCEREDDYHEAVGTVVAWMLLPTPYKSGEEE